MTEILLEYRADLVERLYKAAELNDGADYRASFKQMLSREMLDKDADIFAPKEKPRHRLGASAVGEECERAIWYKWRWYSKEEINGRQRLLFHRGHLEEVRIKALMHVAGMRFEAEQERWYAHENHLSGAIDCYGDGYILEFKTMARKYFDALLKTNKLEVGYSGQVRINQAFNGRKTSSRVIAVCKDTDRIYVGDVKYNEGECITVVEKTIRIISAKQPPEKLSNLPTFFKCKMCPSQAVCHANDKIKKSCRSCVHGEPTHRGDWLCKSTGQILTLAEQWAGCKEYKVLK